MWSLVSSSWSFRYAASSDAFESLVKIHCLNAGGFKGFLVPAPF